MILDFLDRPIAFHRCFVEISGSVTAALLLSQAWYWQRRAQDGDGWFFKTREEWSEETGLSRKEQETARARLREIGVLEEERRGLPAKLFYRVNSDVLEDLLNRLVGPKVTDCKDRIGPTVRPESGKHLNETKTTAKTTAKNKTPTPLALPSWLPSEAWAEFVQHRKDIKKPLSDLATQKNLKLLDELRSQGEDPVRVIEQSIANGWQGLFAVRKAAAPPRGGPALPAQDSSFIPRSRRNSA
jgi:hypothetical protein